LKFTLLFFSNRPSKYLEVSDGQNSKSVDTRRLKTSATPDNFTVFWLSHLTRVEVLKCDRSTGKPADSRRLECLLGFFEKLQESFPPLEFVFSLDRPWEGLDNEQIFRRIDSLPFVVTLVLGDVDEECCYPVSLLTKTPFQVKLRKSLVPMKWRSFYFSCPDKIVGIQHFYGELSDMVESISEQYGAVKSLEVISVELDCLKWPAALIDAMNRLVSITFIRNCTIFFHIVTIL
jgi:hypothetical protein